MKILLHLGLGCAVIAASSVTPVMAQPARFDPGLASESAMPLTNVQFRDGIMRRVPGGGSPRMGGIPSGRRVIGGQRLGGGNRFGGGQQFGGGQRFDGGYRRRGGYGVGAGIAGLAAGAIIGGAIASQGAPGYGYGDDPGYVNEPLADDPGYAYAQPQAVEGDPSAYCAQQFRSYDPSSGTYLGYDGERHPCP